MAFTARGMIFGAGVSVAVSVVVSVVVVRDVNVMVSVWPLVENLVLRCKSALSTLEILCSGVLTLSE